MVTKPVEQTTVDTADTAKGGEKASKCCTGAFPDLSALVKAYQDMAARHAERLTASIQSLSSVKSPVEFMEIQQKLLMEGFEAIVSDSRMIAELTTSVFSTAFEPMQRHIGSFQDLMKKQG